jgi:hypothetical protein
MTDSFDLQRKLDESGAELVGRAMDAVAESGEKARERDARLIPLDRDHFFDPQEKIILVKEGKHFKNLGHDRVYLKLAAEQVEEEARRQGFTTVAGGFFWNPASRQLYVKNGGHYVLYSLDRRSAAPAESGTTGGAMPERRS